MICYTIGYGGRKPEQLVDALRQASVTVLVDVRAQPVSRGRPLFTRSADPTKGISGLVSDAGLAYRWEPTLGNPFRRDPEGERKLWAVLDEKGRDLLAPLCTLSGPICLLCAERDHEWCHRATIARWARRNLGWEIHHL